ncbi:Cd(II)/Pb(II)-responsive transcriptional regulator [Xenophilus aerolatus]|nr:Cd(II)/Pb(II)-responsive transcriptional regulator [Xenophilus aerolatus]
MKIGELALTTGCSVPTIRYYEAEGLLQAPARTASNYREYGAQHADRLAFILRCRSLDMSHEEIRVLLSLQDEPGKPCDEVNALLDAHVRLVEQRIVQLTALRKQLQAIRSTCAGGVCIGDCGALESLRSATGTSLPV